MLKVAKEQNKLVSSKHLRQVTGRHQVCQAQVQGGLRQAGAGEGAGGQGELQESH